MYSRIPVIYDTFYIIPVIPGRVIEGRKDQSVVLVVPVLTVVMVEPVNVGAITDTILDISFDNTENNNS